MLLNVRRLTICLSAVFCSLCANAGSGVGAYRFLNLPFDARMSGLGGENVSLQASDVNMAGVNPALLSGDVHNKLCANFISYLDDAKAGSLSYAYTPDSSNYFGIGFVYLGYGDFQGYDQFGNPTEEFGAGDLCVGLRYAKNLGYGMKLGVAMKPVYSHIEDYSSFALAFDVGFNYYNPEKQFSVGVSARNFGVQCKKYYDSDKRDEMPFNLQLGVTKGLQHAPFRFSVTYDRLNDWNLDYYRQKEVKSMVGEEPENDVIKGGDMFFRHLVFGVEALLGKNFYIEAAYNHRRKREFELSGSRGFNGFSIGTGLKVYAFNLDFSFSQYALSANTITLSLTTDLDRFKKK